MDYTDIGWGYMVWIYLAQDRDRWQVQQGTSQNRFCWMMMKNHKEQSVKKTNSYS
jgi:hypothetical protein